MSFFKQVEGEAAILVTNGVYSQTELYTWNGYLYAKSGSGFVRLMMDGATTKSATRLAHISWTGQLFQDALGRLCTGDVVGAIDLDERKAQLLLG
jgi:hypothetical protein